MKKPGEFKAAHKQQPDPRRGGPMSMMRYRAVRGNLVQVVVARMVKHFAASEVKASVLPELITSEIRTQALLYNIPKRHWDQMVEDGLGFYQDTLQSVVEVLVSKGVGF